MKGFGKQGPLSSSMGKGPPSSSMGKGGGKTAGKSAGKIGGKGCSKGASSKGGGKKKKDKAPKLTYGIQLTNFFASDSIFGDMIMKFVFILTFWSDTFRIYYSF